MAAEKTLKIMVEAGQTAFGSQSSGLSIPSGASSKGRSAAQAEKDNFNALKKSTDKLHSTFKSNVPPLNRIFKKMGIEVGMKSILKQSQIFTGVVGSIFQILGALVDVTLAPFLPVIVPAIRKLGKLIPWWAKKVNSKMDSVNNFIGMIKSAFDALVRFINVVIPGELNGLGKTLVAILAILAMKKGLGLLMRGLGRGMGKAYNKSLPWLSRSSGETAKQSKTIAKNTGNTNRGVRGLLKALTGKKGRLIGAGLGLGVGAYAATRRLTGGDGDKGANPDLDKNPNVVETTAKTGKIVPTKITNKPKLWTPGSGGSPFLGEINPEKVAKTVTRAKPGTIADLENIKTGGTHKRPTTAFGEVGDSKIKTSGSDRLLKKYFMDYDEMTMGNNIDPNKGHKSGFFDNLKNRLKLTNNAAQGMSEMYMNPVGTAGMTNTSSALANVKSKMAKVVDWMTGVEGTGDYAGTTSTQNLRGTNINKKVTSGGGGGKSSAFGGLFSAGKSGLGKVWNVASAPVSKLPGMATSPGSKGLAKSLKTIPIAGAVFEGVDAIFDAKHNFDRSRDRWGTGFKGTALGAGVAGAGFVADIALGALSEIDPTFVTALAAQEAVQMGINKYITKAPTTSSTLVETGNAVWNSDIVQSGINSMKSTPFTSGFGGTGGGSEVTITINDPGGSNTNVVSNAGKNGNAVRFQSYSASYDVETGGGW